MKYTQKQKGDIISGMGIFLMGKKVVSTSGHDQNYNTHKDGLDFLLSITLRYIKFTLIFTFLQLVVVTATKAKLRTVMALQLAHAQTFNCGVSIWGLIVSALVFIYSNVAQVVLGLSAASGKETTICQTD